jgi:hypothetical protein
MSAKTSTDSATTDFCNVVKKELDEQTGVVVKLLVQDVMKILILKLEYGSDKGDIPNS